MQTTYIGQDKFIVRGARCFRMAERSADAATEAEWADKILAAPAVVFPNGRNSHETAGEVLERAEDILIEYLVITT